MSGKVVFRLKRFWEIDGETVDLYKEIKSGRKTIEYRDVKSYWISLLIKDSCIDQFLELSGDASKVHDLTCALKARKAWFVVGFPKGNVPRLEADITKLELCVLDRQFRIHFANVKEVTAVQVQQKLGETS